MAPKYCYITVKEIGTAGEIVVQGKDRHGGLLFGFRAMQDGTQTWREKARRYTPTTYIPTFEEPGKAKVKR